MVDGVEHGTDAGASERAEWERLADRLVLAVRPGASANNALIRLPGPVSGSGGRSDGLEGFARTFLAAAFRVGGAGGEDPHGMLEWYARGLRHGTDPGSPERWPRMTERRQARVEAASIVVALSETRPWLWDHLDQATQERVVDWLADIVGTSDYGNNWLWFQNVVESFLASVGGPWQQADRDRNEELAERLYVGDGWYSDGFGRDGRRQSFDHYAGWAWHFYPLLDARIRGEALEERHRSRLAAFLEQASLLVSRDGSPLLQGRSLAYRFAVLAPFWAGSLAGVSPLRPGQTRALTGAVRRHFLAHGALGESDVLSIGWHGEYPRIRQLYTGAGSPYWASKGLLGLLLPPEDPVWSAPEEPLPHWETDHAAVLEAPGWLVQATAADGVVRVLNHGSDRLVEAAGSAYPDDPFYRRAAYSTNTSPQLSAYAIAAPLDSHTALLDEHDVPSHRGGIERVRLEPGLAVSRSRVHWLDLPGSASPGDSASWAHLRLGPLLTTVSVVHGDHEVRLAWIDPAPPDSDDPTSPAADDSPWPEAEGPWRIRFGGWPLAAASPEELAETSASGVRRSDGLTSTVVALRGVDRTGVERFESADPLGEASAVPWAVSTEPLLPGDVAAALVVLSGAPERRPEPVVEFDGRTVTVRWPDGHLVEIPHASPEGTPS